MAYTARDALKFAYPLLSQHGATRAIGGNNFFYSLNMALNFIYDYNGYIRSRQHVKDVFTYTGHHHLKLITRWPVATVDKFYRSERVDVDGNIAPCTCGDDLPHDHHHCCHCCVPCNDVVACCHPDCQPLKLRRILPNNTLCENEYQVSGSEQKGMGGMGGRIVKIYLQNNHKNDHHHNSLIVTYYRGVKHITSRDEIVPLPDSFMHVLGFMIAAICVPLYGIMMQQQDLNYRSLAKKELDSLKMADNVFPDQVRFDPQYPVFERAQPNPVGMGNYVLP